MSDDERKPAAKRSASFVDESRRQNKYNKKRSVKKKENQAYKKQQNLHDTFLLHNEVKEFYETKSPHILMTKNLKSIERNSIIFQNHFVNNQGKKDRKIYYNIKSIGENIYHSRKKKYINCHIGNTEKQVIYFLVDHRELLNHPKISLFTETGKPTNSLLNEKSIKGYILLGFATYNHNTLEDNHPLLSTNDITMLRQFRINKTNSKVSHHFNTKGTIFSFGYGPKYDKKNKHNYSIGIYADKTSRKKISAEERYHMLSIENRIECAMVKGIQTLSKNTFITKCWITTCWYFDKLYGIIYRKRKNETSNPTLWFLELSYLLQRRNRKRAYRM